jgi:anti-anti-sigma regulatory factor
MNSIRNLSSNKGTIRLEGDLTLPNAAKLKKILIKALINADAVTIQFGDVQDLDLSCLQLLCSAHRSAVRLKKQIRFEGSLPKILQETADAAGYLRLKGCQLDSEKSCFWIGAGGAHHG